SGDLMPALKTQPEPTLPASAVGVEHPAGHARVKIREWPPFQRRAETNNRYARQNDRKALIATEGGIDIIPSDVANRRAKSFDGMTAEVVQTTRRERFDVRFCAPIHMAVFIEQGVRAAGETAVDGLQRSTLRDLRHKLSFVPAWHAYHEWQQPSLPFHAIYFYF